MPQGQDRLFQCLSGSLPLQGRGGMEKSFQTRLSLNKGGRVTGEILNIIRGYSSHFKFLFLHLSTAEMARPPRAMIPSLPVCSDIE